ncbi:hypothetical protein NQ315_011363 [Exocentrus adspersus]|uniref:Uncharacterized protein n=1 Tax=Exocentrus adspersus TaxID=1586481 RepID=A0AAV8V534_9CUCU|nr:hypothetical protein NQ315_011363 [Exocentrus adspersus]
MSLCVGVKKKNLKTIYKKRCCLHTSVNCQRATVHLASGPSINDKGCWSMKNNIDISWTGHWNRRGLSKTRTNKFANEKAKMKATAGLELTLSVYYAQKYRFIPKFTIPEQYTGHCFRRSSTSILADSGADLLTIKRHGVMENIDNYVLEREKNCLIHIR